METIQYTEKLFRRSILILAFLPAVLFAQQAKVNGKISAAKTGERLPGVTILLDGKPVAAGDPDGNYEFSADSGKHELMFRLISFQDKLLTVRLSPGQILLQNVSLDESAKELGVVVVSAGKFEQRLEDVTVSMQVIKPGLIEESNTVKMDEAINKIPGVNVIDGQANIRGGSGWSYGAGSRVQVLVDDLPQLTADAGDTKWTFLPVENLQQVEVIKGASSVLFGSSALNGVINIRTAYPGDKPFTKVNVFTGFYDQHPSITLHDTSHSLNWWGRSAQLNEGMDFLHSQKFGSLDFVAGGNIYADDGFRKGESEIRSRFNTNLRYHFKKVPGLFAGVNLNTMMTEGTLFFLWKNDTSAGYIPATGTLSDYTTYRTNIDPFITYADSKGNVQKLRARWFNSTNQNSTNQNSTGNVYYSEYQYQHHFKELLVISAGMVAQQNVVNSELYGDHKGNQYAGYSQADLKWKRISFSAGVRVEHNRIDSLYSSWIPVLRSGINIHVLKATYLRASVGQGYRFPAIAELFIRTNIGSLMIYPNDSLKAEKGLSKEIGIRQGVKLGKWMGFLDAAVFSNEYHNMMEFCFASWGAPVPPTFGLGFRSFNVGNTRIQGIDLSASGEGNIAGSLTATVIAGWTWIDPRQTFYDSIYIAKVGKANFMGSDSSNFLKYRNKNMVRADLELGYHRLTLGISFRYTSRMVNIDRIFENPLIDNSFPPGLGIGHYRANHKTGDSIYDLRAAWQVQKNIRFSVIVKNLFNHIYMDRPARYEDPRVWVFQLGFKF